MTPDDLSMRRLRARELRDRDVCIDPTTGRRSYHRWVELVEGRVRGAVCLRCKERRYVHYLRVRRPRLQWLQRMWCGLRKHTLSHVFEYDHWEQDPTDDTLGKWMGKHEIGYQCLDCDRYVG